MLLTRALIKRFAGSLLLCIGVFACVLAASPAAASAKKTCSAPKTAWKFVSAPRLHPMHVHICTRKKHEAPGMILTDPFVNSLSGKRTVGQTGALMMDQGGHPVWFHRARKNEEVTDFQVTQFDNQPALTFWEGIIAVAPKYTNIPPGSPEKGAFYIYNDHYKLVKVLKAQDGWTADLHELLITPPATGHPLGTAYFIAAKKVPMNLSKYGGPAKGAIENDEIQEVDIKTGKLLLAWNMLKHVSLKHSEVHAPKSGVWDPYHANSLDLSKSGDVLLSARDTWGVYEISPTSGKILWQINGKCATKVCLRPSKNGRFYWQHDAKFVPGSKDQEISVFDDACCNPAGGYPKSSAHGLILKLGLTHRTANLVHLYTHPNTKVTLSQGSVQKLSDGHVFIGWGQTTQFSGLSEYTSSGRMLYDAAFPKSDISYRALKFKWVGTPEYPPSAAVRHSKGRTTMYASWNGATTVASWRVLGGTTKSSQTKKLGHSARKGFETAIRLSGKDAYYKVEALGSKGQVLNSTVIKG